MYRYLGGKRLTGVVGEQKLDELGVVLLRSHVERCETILQTHRSIIHSQHSLSPSVDFPSISK